MKNDNIFSNLQSNGRRLEVIFYSIVVRRKFGFHFRHFELVSKLFESLRIVLLDAPQQITGFAL